MNPLKIIILLGAWAGSTCIGLISSASAAPNIVPSPTSLTEESGVATLTASSSVYFSSEVAEKPAQLLSGDLDRVFGMSLNVSAGNSPAAGDVVLRIVTDPALGSEGYRLTVATDVVIEANSVDGLFAGSVSLVQSAVMSGATLEVPRMTIFDEPFKSQRSLMIDIKNQWHSISDLENFVDLCRFYKVRHLSLHTGEEQWIGSVMNSTASIPQSTRQSERLYTKGEMDGLIAYAADRGVYLFPHNETTEGFSGMRSALQNDFDGPGGFPNWVQEAYADEGVDFSSGNAEGLDGFVDSDGGGVDDNDPDYWKAIGIFTKRGFAQFGAAYPSGKLPYYHMGPVLGEGGTSTANAEKVLDILREVDADVKLMFWNGMNAGALSNRKDDIIICFYSPQFSSSGIDAYLNDGWSVLNTAWSPLYIVGTNIVRTQQQVHDDWNTFRSGTDGFSGGTFTYGAISWDLFDTPAAQNLLTGGMLATWEVPQAIHLDRVRVRLPAMAEHAWNHKSWPYPETDFDDFRSRYLATDALLNDFLGLAAVSPSEPERLEATNGDLANAIAVSWNGSSGFPDGYRVWRNTSDNFAGATQIAEVAVDESYTDNAVMANTPYYYWVRAFNETGESSAAGSVLGSAGDGIARTEAYESFSYSAGTIDGKNGGEGWRNAWDITVANGVQEVVPTGLSYGDLPTSGGALRITPSNDNPSVGVVRDLEEAMGTGGTTVWLSYLIKGDPVANGHGFLSFEGAPGIGKRWGNQFAFENDASDASMASGNTYFVVVRFDFAASDTMTMWINPSLDSEPTAGNANLTTGAEVSVTDRLRLNFQGWGRGVYTLDEIRLGPSWDFAVGGDGEMDPDDMNPPSPDPMTWISPPVLEGSSSAAMAATPASDPWGVEYYFEELSGNPGGDSSGWQESAVYTDAGLQSGFAYTYRVRARDKSPQNNETNWSFSSSVTLQAPGQSEPDGVADGASDVSLNSVLGWTSASGAVSYDVYFGTTNPLASGDLRGNQETTSFDPTPLAPETTYYWRVDAVNSFGTSTGTTWSFTTGAVPSSGPLLLHEEFDGYQAGSIIGQQGLGLGLTGAWEFQGTAGTFEIGAGLSGPNGLVVTADGTGGLDAKIAHNVEGWGTGVLYMSYLWNELSYGGHAYVSGGGSWPGAVGHAWSTTWAVNNSGDGVSYSSDQTYRLVAKIDWDNGETTMWADPVAESDTPVASKSEAQAGGNQTLILRYYGTDGVIDDIRVGPTFDSVVNPVGGGNTELTLTDFSYNGASMTISFEGESGQTDWQIMASLDLNDFDINETANSTVMEVSPGIYTAVVDLTGAPATYFLRIEEGED